MSERVSIILKFPKLSACGLPSGVKIVNVTLAKIFTGVDSGLDQRSFPVEVPVGDSRQDCSR